MKGLMVILITGVMAVGAAGCAAASAYKFKCDKEGVCKSRPPAPPRWTWSRSSARRSRSWRPANNRTTLAAGPARKTFKMGETGALGPMTVTVRNIKGEQAFFTVQ